MASSTPPLTTTKPYQNHHFHHPNNRRPQLSLSSQASHVSGHLPPTPSAVRPNFRSLSVADFSGRRSTRWVSKMHFGRPRSTAASRHSDAAEAALRQVIGGGGDVSYMDNVLLTFQPKLHLSDDYIFLLRELGNRGDFESAIRCFEFAISLEKRRNEKGKLCSTMISTLGRLGKVDLAKKVFDDAVCEGYGNTVYAYSSLISAYAKSGNCDEAIGVFMSMKESGLKPNLVTYNALIDACGKGGADYKRALEVFDDMLYNGVNPDKITYNSLIAVYSGAGLWNESRSLFDEMIRKGIDQDIYTYNTLLDAACVSGNIDVAFDIMTVEMPAKNISPNQVTYTTMISGCAKAGKLDKALSLFDKMKSDGIKCDRVSYNTLLAVYASLGRFDEAFSVVKEMESIGIKKDVVTYNALLDGFGKQGMYHKVKELFEEMKRRNVHPNLLTYSTLISVYCKGGLYEEATEAYREFKLQGLKADVVFYSKLIDALCKKGLVESSSSLLDEMMRDGIQPNVVTYNSIINAFGQSETFDSLESRAESSNLEIYADGKIEARQDDRIIKVFRKLAGGKHDEGARKDFQCVLGVFCKMHEKKIKPNVVTFSAILNACSRCNSFEEASLLLDELRLFDNQVYGLAHGLLMGHNDHTWSQALSLFNEVKRMDSSTASAFYNALTDVLWHFGQKRGAQLVVLEGKRREVWENTWTESCLDLHLMSSGAARAMVHAWLLSIRSIVFKGHELPKLLSILTGWGKHSKVVGKGALKRTIEALLVSLGAPFQVAKCNIGRFTSTGSVVAAWLRESSTLEVLVLKDERTQPRFGIVPNLQPLPL